MAEAGSVQRASEAEEKQAEAGSPEASKEAAPLSKKSDTKRGLSSLIFTVRICKSPLFFFVRIYGKGFVLGSLSKRSKKPLFFKGAKEKKPPFFKNTFRTSIPKPLTCCALQGGQNYFRKNVKYCHKTTCKEPNIIVVYSKQGGSKRKQAPSEARK